MNFINLRKDEETTITKWDRDLGQSLKYVYSPTTNSFVVVFVYIVVLVTLYVALRLILIDVEFGWVVVVVVGWVCKVIIVSNPTQLS